MSDHRPAFYTLPPISMQRQSGSTSSSLSNLLNPIPQQNDDWVPAIVMPHAEGSMTRAEIVSPQPTADSQPTKKHRSSGGEKQPEDKRREQNRVAQKTYRQRREQYLTTLEARYEALQHDHALAIQLIINLNNEKNESRKHISEPTANEQLFAQASLDRSYANYMVSAASATRFSGPAPSASPRSDATSSPAARLRNLALLEEATDSQMLENRR